MGFDSRTCEKDFGPSLRSAWHGGAARKRSVRARSEHLPDESADNPQGLQRTQPTAAKRSQREKSMDVAYIEKR